MPELPEVETVRRQLSRAWKGRCIERVQCGRPSYFFITPPRVLSRNLEGKTLTKLTRHGKTMVAHFEGGDRFLFHLGMTGQFVAKELPQDGHVHLILHLNGSRILSFRDVRKFGKVEWLQRGTTSPRLEHLGPDALSVTGEILRNAFKGRRVPVKTALLNQSLLAGVGNIYADEALFDARLHPTRSAGMLTQSECILLAKSVQTILTDSIAAGGSTINDYVQTNGKSGKYQNLHQVYGKTGNPCPRCSTLILRSIVGGRSTHFCPLCQG